MNFQNRPFFFFLYNSFSRVIYRLSKIKSVRTDLCTTRKIRTIFLLASQARAIMMMTLGKRRRERGGVIIAEARRPFRFFFRHRVFRGETNERACNSRLIGRNEIFPATVGPMTNALRNIFRYGQFMAVIKRGLLPVAQHCRY